MRLARMLHLFLLIGCSVGLFADLTIIQAVQPLEKGEALQPGQEMVLYLSGEKLRLDSGEVSSIIRGDSKKTYSLLHAEKRYIILPHKDKPRPAARQSIEPVKGTPTGKTDLINGFNCLEMLVDQSDGTRMNAWVTTDPAAIRALESVRKWQSGGYADLLAGMGFKDYDSGGSSPGFPVKTTVLDENGKPSVIVEVKRLDNRPIKADLFEPPPGYQEHKVEESAQSDEAADLGKRLLELEEATQNLEKKDAEP